VPYLLTFAWIVAVIYASIPPFWLVIHPFAERWRRSEVGARKLLGFTWLATILLLAAVTAPWRELRLYDTPYAWLAALPFGGLALLIYGRAGGFGFDRLIGRVELESNLEQRLITTGLHRRIRHPFYLAHLFMLTGWTLGSGLLVLYALWAFALLTGFFLIRTEDAELERRFGDEYREYKRGVPAILPLP
jgi:protein-S-isoprenylcysteine O-methyltransferase Ste14